MKKDKDQNSDIEPQAEGVTQQPGGGDLDAAGMSLASALKSSFIILKGIMVLFVCLFLVSGFNTVGPDENALVLRFGKIRGMGEERVLKSGLHWILPQPIEEMVKIPVLKNVDIPINSFWYFQKDTEILPEGPGSRVRIPKSLNPIYDGYCITRNEQSEQGIGEKGSDYNIVHCKWQLTYRIDNPELFYKNVYIEDVKPGDIYFDVVTRSLEPFLENLVEDSVVTAMVNYTIDQAIQSYDRIPRHVERLLRGKLEQIESGIEVVSVKLTQCIWPRQVNAAFLASITAKQTSETVVTQARTYAENTLNEAAGRVAPELLAVLYGKEVSEEEEELLWKYLAGEAQERIAHARSYRTNVVESTKASGEYLQQILPEYRKRPELVVQKLYQDAIEEVLDNVEEKMIIRPTEGAKGKEIRVLLNRDPAIKPKASR